MFKLRTQSYQNRKYAVPRWPSAGLLSCPVLETDPKGDFYSRGEERSVERGATFAFYWVFMVQLSSGLATPGVKVLVYKQAVGNKVQNDNYQLTLGQHMCRRLVLVIYLRMRLCFTLHIIVFLKIDSSIFLIFFQITKQIFSHILKQF